MKKILFVLIATLVMYGCAEDETITTGSIYGVITDKATAEPMRATGVELFGYSGNNQYSLLITKTVTYDDGHYEFNNLKAGNYGLLVSAEGYKEIAYVVTVESGQTAKGDMQLDKVNTYMTVKTLEVSNIEGNSAILNGSVSYSSSVYKPNECGFVYATHSNPANGGTIVKASSSSFFTTINNLSKGTYYVRAYAKNSYGTEYGEERNFLITGMPVVTTLPATNVTGNAATLNGKIEYKGDPAFTERGFVYSNTFQNPTIEDNASATTKQGVSGISVDFSANVTGLTAEKTYYIRAYATNSNGTVYGEPVSFKPTSIVDCIVLSGHGIAVQKTDISAGTDWSSAKSLCAASRVGGYSDWRLPTIGELSVLYTNQAAIGGFTTTKGSSSYWSSTVYTGYYGDYYFYDFYSGSQSYQYNYYSFRVRAVRTLL